MAHSEPTFNFSTEVIFHMGWRFSKRIRILPGVSLNIGKRGVSTTIGPRGLSVNIGKKGAYLNAGIPGTGISHRSKISSGGNFPGSGFSSTNAGPIMGIGLVAIVAFGIFIYVCALIGQSIGSAQPNTPQPRPLIATQATSQPTPLPSPTSTPDTRSIYSGRSQPGNVHPYKSPTPYPSSAPDYSPYSDSYDYSPGDTTVTVRGYTRKDGTYVRPHTRSAPRSRR